MRLYILAVTPAGLLAQDVCYENKDHPMPLFSDTARKMNELNWRQQQQNFAETAGMLMPLSGWEEGKPIPGIIKKRLTFLAAALRCILLTQGCTGIGATAITRAVLIKPSPTWKQPHS
jgi:hypothetical protein